MEKRRRRVEAWQAQRRKLQQQEEEQQNVEAAAAATAEEKRQEEEERKEEEEQEKKWNLDDEDGLSDGEMHGEEKEEVVDTEKTMAPPPPPPPPSLLKLEKENEDDDPLDAFMKDNQTKLWNKDDIDSSSAPAVAAVGAAAAAKTEQEDLATTDANTIEDDIDPLDAFMAANVLPAVASSSAPQTNRKSVAPSNSVAELAQPTTLKSENNNKNKINNNNNTAKNKKKKRRRKRIGTAIGASSDEDAWNGYTDSDEEGDKPQNGSDDEDDDEAWARKVQAGIKLSKGDKLGITDHAAINYPPFRRNFYIEVPELARMTPPEVAAYRKQLDGVKVRGKDVPKPIRNWNQCGLSTRVLETIKKLGFDKPLPIQAQALPVIMGGRDCIGIAKTGSGKTLAFVLPMIRHVKDQPPLAPGDGPIGLIMAPTRELISQIGKEVRRFSRAAGLECTCVYGGSGVANQISELKRGSEIVVCTPGRMIDILATGAGKITNLRRVTYLVLDEADRMFDMGFEPQIMRIVNNIRPDRQTVLFSATFPRQVESLVRQVLANPVEIQVGGKSIVNSDITQYIEIRPESDRFLRLLELLGEWYERGKILIFVSSQDRCDTLFRDLLRSGYPCLSLHGGKDQSDRESTISDFKSAVCNVLVATSVAARGLDVKELVLVVNYDCPNHHEDYVHRVGRTGRAGAKGTAVTFIAPEEEQFAPDLVKALNESRAPIPADLAALADGFDRKRKAGLVKAHGSGFGGTGYKFNEEEEMAIKEQKKAAAKEFGMVEESSDSEEDEEARAREDEEEEKQMREKQAQRTTAQKQQQQQQGSAVASVQQSKEHAALPADIEAKIKAAQDIAAKLTMKAPAPPGSGTAATTGVPPPAAGGGGGPDAAKNTMLAAAQAAAQRLAAQRGGGGKALPPPMHARPSVSASASGVPNIAAAAAAALQAMGVTPAAALAGNLPTIPGSKAAPPTPAPPPITLPAPPLPNQKPHFETELEINDFPQQARWKVTHRETVREINEQLGAAIVVKGRYVKPGDKLPEGERKLYLHISAHSADILRRAKGDIKKMLEESTEKAMRKEAPGGMGRYSIL